MSPRRLPTKPTGPTLIQIMEATAAEFNLEASDLRARTRGHDINLARAAFVFLAVNELGAPYTTADCAAALGRSQKFCKRLYDIALRQYGVDDAFELKIDLAASKLHVPLPRTEPTA